MSDKDKYISELEDEIKKLRHQVDNLTEFLVLAQKQKIGSSSEEIEYIPAQVIFQNKLWLPELQKAWRLFHKKAFTPISLLNHSLASAFSVANVMYQKYVNAISLYRQEKEWEQMGIELSRATMANWVIRCSESWLAPIVDCLHQELLTQEVIHCAETPIQVLKEDGKKAQSKSYMWVYRSGKDEEKPVVIYDYNVSRSGEITAKYLKSFHKYLHTDGYAGYEKVENVTRCCWAHLRRYFVEANVVEKSDNNIPKTAAETRIEYCDKLFYVEKNLVRLSPDIQKRTFSLPFELCYAKPTVFLPKKNVSDLKNQFWRLFGAGLKSSNH